MLRQRLTSEHLPAQVPPAQRARLWAEQLAAVGLCFDFPNPNQFSGTLDVAAFPGATVTRVSASSAIAHRQQAQVARDSEDQVILFFNDDGARKQARQNGRAVDLAVGQVTLLDHTIAHVCDARDGGAATGVLLPKAELEASGVDLTRAFCRDHHTSGALGLLRVYAATILEQPTPGDRDLHETARQHLVELAVLAFGGKADALARAREHGARAARARVLRGLIRERATDPGVNEGRLGAELGMSERSVQKLLRDVGTSFGSELLAARLDWAASALAGRHATRASIAKIAFEAGFNSVPTFYRAFRARYGVAPGEARERKDDCS